MCAKFGDKVFFLTSGRHRDLNRKHIKGAKKCKECDELYFISTKIEKDWRKQSYEVKLPIKHKHCKGLIHLDRRSFADGYSCDINLILKCEKCGKRLDTWTEGESIDDEFKKAFNFIPKKRRFRK